MQRLIVALSFLALSGCIVGGDLIKHSEAPWQVALIQGASINKVEGLKCGGVAIDSQWVLTAAHCFYNDKDKINSPDDKFYIGYGSANLLRGIVKVSIVQIELGRRFQGGGLVDDIALVKVSPPMQISSYMRLPDEGIERERKKSNLPVMVTGWGYTQFRRKSEDLRGVEIRTVDYSACQSKRTRKLPSEIICAGEEGRDSCTFDSGGPLFVGGKLPSRQMQIGVVIYGPEKCGSGVPGVYTDVYSYLPWIKETREKY
ncbi:serine protease [Pseudomonas aeruginosa]